jgi:hypothetical protein
MLLRLPYSPSLRSQASPGPALRLVAPPQAAAASGTTAPWPERPAASVLSKSIPLFFISRDTDGFWIACEAGFRIGERCSGPARCATMTLSGPHSLDIENRGNRLVARLRPLRRSARRVGSRFRILAGTVYAAARRIGARWSRAYMEDRMLRAAMEVELYRSRYKHSNKNDDDLPIVTDIRTLKRIKQGQPTTAPGEDVWPMIVGFVIFSFLLAGVIALTAMIWLPANTPT